ILDAPPSLNHVFNFPEVEFKEDLQEEPEEEFEEDLEEDPEEDPEEELKAEEMLLHLFHLLRFSYSLSSNIVTLCSTKLLNCISSPKS
nr:hypothetical protein [Tanacetum cinerariifolium]